MASKETEDFAKVRGRLTQLALNALHATKHATSNWREEQKALFDAIAALDSSLLERIMNATPQDAPNDWHDVYRVFKSGPDFPADWPALKVAFAAGMIYQRSRRD